MQFKKEAIKDLKMLHGMPPYDSPSNYCKGDGYFANNMIKKYNMSMRDLIKKTGFNQLYSDYEKDLKVLQEKHKTKE